MPLTAPTIAAPEVAPGELPGVRLPTMTPEQLGGGTAAGLNAVGDVAKDIAIEQKKNSDEVVSQDASNQFAKVTLDHTQAVLSTKGRAAGQAMQDAQAEIAKQKDTIADSLTDNTQRRAFHQMAAQHELTAQHWMGRHVAEQADVADQQSTVDSVKIAQQTGANFAHDPTTVKLQQQSIIDTVTAAGQRQGWDPPTLAENKLQALSGLHVGVVTQMLSDGQGGEAKAYISEHREEILPAERDHLLKQSEHVDVLGQAQKNADSIMAQTKGDLGAAMVEVQKISDPNLRQETQQQVVAQHSIAKQNEDEQQRGAFKNAMGYINNEHLVNPLAMYEVQLLKDKMTPEQWDTVVARGTAKVKDEKITTNWNVYEDISSRLTSPDQRIVASALKEDIPGTYGSQLADAQMDKLIDMQNGARKLIEKGTPDEKLASEALVRQIGTDTLIGHGFAGKVDESTPGTPDVPNPKNVLVVQFQTALRRAVDARSAMDPKAKITPELIQQEADKLLIKHATGQQSRGFFGSILSVLPFVDVHTGDTPSEYPFQNPKLATSPVSVKELPKAVSDKIKSDYRAQWGYDPLPEEVMTMYYKKHAPDASP